ncbi:hypothetical protein DLREEDagr8_48550 [Dongia sp. agr-C8]
MAAILLLPLARTGIGTVGRDQLFGIIRLLIRRDEALPVATILAGALVAAVDVLRLTTTLTLLVRMVLLAGILVRAHLAVAVAALLIFAAMLRLVATMTMTRERRREALAHVLHVDIRDGDFPPADSRPLTFVLRRHDPVIVIGMLQEILRGNAVAGGAGIACELQILLEDLIGVAADPDIGSRAVVVVSLALSAAAMAPVRAAMGFARAAAAAASILVIRSHASITSHCCGPGFAPRPISPR